MEVEQQPADEMGIVLPDKTLVDGHGNPVISDAEELAEELTGGDDDGENESGEGQTGETDETLGKKAWKDFSDKGLKRDFEKYFPAWKKNNLKDFPEDLHKSVYEAAMDQMFEGM